MVKFIRLAEVLFWALLAYFIASNQSNIIVWLLTSAYGDPSSAPPIVLQNLVFVSPAFPLFLGALALFRLTLARESVGALFGFSQQRIVGDVLLGLLVGIASIAITVFSMRTVAAYAPLPPFGQMPMKFHLYFATIGAVIPGIFEELYFRGLLFRVGAGLPKALLIVLSAAAFSVWHVGTLAYLPHTFILGLLWGVMFAVTGRLAPSIIAHVTANAGFGLLLLSGFTIIAAQ